MSASGRLKIAACVGVELPTHERWLPVPKGPERAACMGVWTVATCMCRMRETDGWCALEWLDAYATPEIVSRLVEVGLFAYEDQNGVHGVRVLRYEDWNETKAEIDKRLRDGRRRQKNSRSRRNVTRDSAVTDTVTNGVTDTVTQGVTLGEGIGEGEGSDPGESERGSGVVRLEVAPTDGGRRARKKPATYCPGPEESADKLDAWCRGQKLPPASKVPGVLEMVRWHQKNGVPRASWLATWQDWQANAPKYANGTPTRPTGAFSNPADSPRSVEERTRRNRDYDEAKRNAVPPPIGDLMAAIGGGRKA